MKSWNEIYEVQTKANVSEDQKNFISYIESAKASFKDFEDGLKDLASTEAKRFEVCGNNAMKVELTDVQNAGNEEYYTYGFLCEFVNSCRNAYRINHACLDEYATRIRKEHFKDCGNTIVFTSSRDGKTIFEITQKLDGEPSTILREDSFHKGPLTFVVTIKVADEKSETKDCFDNFN